MVATAFLVSFVGVLTANLSVFGWLIFGASVLVGVVVGQLWL
jgi:hypothetical protein